MNYICLFSDNFELVHQNLILGIKPETSFPSNREQNKPCSLKTAICYWLQTTESISLKKSCLKLVLWWGSQHFLLLVHTISQMQSFYVKFVMSAQRFKRKSTNLMPAPQNQIKCFHCEHQNERAAWTCPSLSENTPCRSGF